MAYGATLTLPTITGSHSNYPVLLKTDDFPAAAIDGTTNAIANGGGDLVAYTSSSKTTQIPIDVVSFVSGGTPSAEVWVKLPTAATGNTIYIEKDTVQTVQPAAGSTYGSQAVWSEAETVLLMEDNTPVDHTGTHTYTAAGTITTIAGPFGFANTFAASASVSTSSAVIRDILTTYDTTISLICRRATYAADSPAVAWNGTDDFLCYPFDTASGNGQRLYWRDVGINQFNLDSESLANTWLWSDYTTRASNNHELYTNGASVGTSSATGTAGPFSAFAVGRWLEGQNFLGDVAQVIVWKTARDANWIALQEDNQSTATWLTVGAWSAGGGGVTLTVSNLSHSHALDNVALTQTNILAVNDLNHTHALDNIDLSQANVLALSELLHGHALDNIDLTQAVILAANSLDHSHALDNVDLTQANTLSVAELLHTHALDNVVLSTAINLLIANLIHAHALDNVSLTQANTLSIAELLHGNLIDNVDFTQANILSVQELTHSNLIDNVVLNTSTNLTVSDLLHGHALDAMALTQGHVLTVQELLHSDLLDGNINLGTQITLSVGSLTHAHTLENISWLVIITPSGRTYIVDEKNRVYLVEAKNRTYLVN